MVFTKCLNIAYMHFLDCGLSGMQAGSHESMASGGCTRSCAHMAYGFCVSNMDVCVWARAGCMHTYVHG